MNSQLHDILDGGFIARYHVKGTQMLVPQNVAEHSWRMAAILRHLWPECSTVLLWATLFHDVSERVTGDMPSNVKRHNPALSAALHEVSEAEETRLNIRFGLTEEEQKVLAWIDRFEGALHCFDELEMGNRKVIRTLLRYMEYAADPKYVLSNEWRENLRGRLTRALELKVQGLINHEEPQL